MRRLFPQTRKLLGRAASAVFIAVWCVGLFLWLWTVNAAQDADRMRNVAERLVLAEEAVGRSDGRYTAGLGRLFTQDGRLRSDARKWRLFAEASPDGRAYRVTVSRKNLRFWAYRRASGKLELTCRAPIHSCNRAGWTIAGPVPPPLR